MATIPLISLEKEWRYQLSDGEEDLSARWVDDCEWERVPILSEWSIEAESVVWLRRSVRIRMVDFCVTYFLDVQRVPAKTDFYVNGKHVGTHRPGKGRFAVEVTHLVSLGENLIALRLEDPLSDEVFGSIGLQAVPCD
jgi:beta-galactosidase